MARYRFTTGRYDSSGKRIKGKTERATQGKLSTLTQIRYGKKTHAQAPTPTVTPKTAKVKKTKAYDTVITSKEKPRRVYQYKGSVKTFAQLTLGKQVKKSKFGIVPQFGNRAEMLLENVKRMAIQNRAPDWMLNKIEGMDPNALYLLGQVNRDTIEVYFDYGDMTDEDVSDQDLFWSGKWDDIKFLIDQYERAYGIIESVRWK